MHPDLHSLHLDIDRRVDLILADHPDWLCRKGCDACCRRLSNFPLLTAAEWDLLREGLAALPAAELAEVGLKMAAMAQQVARPLVCPMLDAATGACPVYLQRPVACRTYGFYVQRALGLYCGEIEKQVDAGALAEVVWGNHDAVDQRLAGLGERRALHEWFAHWQQSDS
jgi:Fe-S-cluster containining protein